MKLSVLGASESDPRFGWGGTPIFENFQKLAIIDGFEILSVSRLDHDFVMAMEKRFKKTQIETHGIFPQKPGVSGSDQ